jgi:hypothetical protein
MENYCGSLLRIMYNAIISSKIMSCYSTVYSVLLYSTAYCIKWWGTVCTKVRSSTMYFATVLLAYSLTASISCFIVNLKVLIARR